MKKTGVGTRPAAFVAFSGLLLVGLPALYFLTAYGCGEKEDRLAEVLARAAVLDAAPEGADPEDHYRECGDDDRFVVVGRRYQYRGSPESALGHYRKAAATDGWRPLPPAEGETVSGCFTKSMGDTTAYLDVDSPGDGLLSVEIVADHAGSQWCGGIDHGAGGAASAPGRWPTPVRTT
ncbi:hypothetical protein [Streptomyces sp. NBC_00829]|uniref:hypothetical protein n=1 Tax=Streptomyces sp. NBC_00829 TaxID=2903679 RepID=UPI0038708C87|nr:hypothetical protein OG293_16770 [Streptomyces sp. NBC_00829]